MDVLLFGGTGMIGAGALRECLADDRIASVLVVGRGACGVRHAKLEEILHGDFFDYTPIQHRFADRDACFFCLGRSSVGLDEAAYRRVTLDLTLAAAKAMIAVNDRMTFCYVSGAGTDDTGRGRVMWARVKGETENTLLGMPFKAAYMFRPGYIQPGKGIRSKTPLYHALYTLVRPFYPVLRRLAPRQVTTTAAMGRAMIEVALGGFPQPRLETVDINRLAGEPA